MAPKKRAGKPTRKARPTRPKRKGPARKAAPKRRPAAVVESPPSPVDNARGVLLSINQAATEFGHDRRTVTKRIAELAIAPVDKRNGAPVYRLRDLLEMERRSPDGAHDPDKMSPFERQAHFKAETERLKVDLERRELLRREDVETEWARVLRAVALELDTMVDEIERDVGASPLILEKIEAKVDVIRERMYESVVSGSDGEDQEGDGEAEPAEG